MKTAGNSFGRATLTNDLPRPNGRPENNLSKMVQGRGKKRGDVLIHGKQSYSVVVGEHKSMLHRFSFINLKYLIPKLFFSSNSFDATSRSEPGKSSKAPSSTSLPRITRSQYNIRCPNAGSDADSISRISLYLEERRLMLNAAREGQLVDLTPEEPPVPRRVEFYRRRSPSPKPKNDPYGRRLPLTPQESLAYYGSRLNKYERAEVAQYPQVWYLGLDASKIDGELRGAQNCGYDDDNGSYIKVILGLPYGPPIDMWSLGCILAELYTGYPLFPGENEADQLACIMEIFGPPPASVLEAASRRRLFFDSKGIPRTLTNSKGKKRKPCSKTLGVVLGCNDEDFVNFLTGCLEWDPEKRMKPEESHRHRWLSGNRGPAHRRASTTSTATVKENGREKKEPRVIKEPKNNNNNNNSKSNPPKEVNKKTQQPRKMSTSSTMPRVYKACKTNMRLRDSSRKDYIYTSLSKTSSEESCESAPFSPTTPPAWTTSHLRSVPDAVS
ncbi:dual specificity tyrosine-phosphorylation-regulated kinase 2 [Trichonephila inaurata madagascariensis]|uniref:dual-specificity kinase n=1 Tax=Trichonephila inaurata madagascariensis TaxID=2747483 RepID=A0A8X6YYJ1_9ARAC|nr:dual specificity tyrosine-phosphorylation-regulated kinase 2 [Trichonephila inaurata madagascariensis]